jgi:hypothetical protein
MTRDHTIVDIPGVMTMNAEVVDLATTIDILLATLTEDIGTLIVGSGTMTGDPTTIGQGSTIGRDMTIVLLDTKRQRVFTARLVPH